MNGSPGPTIPVSVTSDLWIRPDKVENAIKHFPDIDTWVVHCIKQDTIRVINLDTRFIERYKRGVYEIVHPRIRGKVETYIGISYNDPTIDPFEKLIAHLKKL